MRAQPKACWRCPVCEMPLLRNAQQWQCEQHHSFDIARQGYVNLLLPQQKNSKEPGDSKEMVLARRAFLSQNHYLPLAQQISTSLLEALSENKFAQKRISIFDAGCGEGYYLSTVASNILASHPEEALQSYMFCGVDIAKPAIQKAAKCPLLVDTHGIFEFAIASSFNLPVLSQSQHAVMQIFAPSKSAEIYRILHTNGLWITVNPASEHLYELKNMVYDKAVKHIPEHVLYEGFTLLSQQTLKFEVLLSTETQRQNLLMMTPFYWAISKEKKQRLLVDLHSTHAHFDIKVFRKI
jgi:23S rRNA (guanine745-N1)-methyltransferase